MVEALNEKVAKDDDKVHQCYMVDIFDMDIQVLEMENNKDMDN